MEEVQFTYGSQKVYPNCSTANQQRGIEAGCKARSLGKSGRNSMLERPIVRQIKPAEARARTGKSFYL